MTKCYYIGIQIEGRKEMEKIIATTRDKPHQYPTRIIVRISQRQAADMAEVKAKTNLTDSDIVRDALQQWLNTTLYSLTQKGK